MSPERPDQTSTTRRTAALTQALACLAAVSSAVCAGLLAYIGWHQWQEQATQTLYLESQVVPRLTVGSAFLHKHPNGLELELKEVTNKGVQDAFDCQVGVFFHLKNIGTSYSVPLGRLTGGQTLETFRLRMPKTVEIEKTPISVEDYFKKNGITVQFMFRKAGSTQELVTVHTFQEWKGQSHIGALP